MAEPWRAQRHLGEHPQQSRVYRPAVGGQQEEMARSIRSLLMALGLAIFLVYLVMASQFESFLHPFVIIFTLPLGAIGVIAALGILVLGREAYDAIRARLRVRRPDADEPG